MKNNKGFSLVELIIVIAILSVLTGVSVVGIGYLYSTNLKSSVKKLDSSLQKVQSFTMTKATNPTSIGLKIKQTGDGWYAEFQGIPGQSDEKLGNKRLKVYYLDSSNNWNQVIAGSDLTVRFDRATGGLLPQDGTTAEYVTKIRITNGSAVDDASKCCTIEIGKVTGKTTMKIYQ